MAKVAVAMCLDHRTWEAAEEIGKACGFLACDRTLVRRVGYLCDERGFHHLRRDAVACAGGHY